MILEKLLENLPSLIGFFSVLLAGFFQNQRVKELQEKIQKNIEIIEKLGQDDDIRVKLKEVVLSDIEKVEFESSKQRDWMALIIAILFIPFTYLFYQWSRSLWGQEGVIHRVGAVTLWIPVGVCALIVLYALWGWLVMRRPEEFITVSKKENRQ